MYKTSHPIDLCVLKHISLSIYFQNFEDLIPCVQKRLFKPINCKLRNYNEKINVLCGSMLRAETNERATIQQIISHPLIMYRMYENYFNFENCYDLGNIKSTSGTSV